MADITHLWGLRHLLCYRMCFLLGRCKLPATRHFLPTHFPLIVQATSHTEASTQSGKATGGREDDTDLASQLPQSPYPHPHAQAKKPPTIHAHQASLPGGHAQALGGGQTGRWGELQPPPVSLILPPLTGPPLQHLPRSSSLCQVTPRLSAGRSDSAVLLQAGGGDRPAPWAVLVFTPGDCV